MTTLAATIDEAFERRAEFSAKNSPPAVRHAMEECIELLDWGQARVAEKKDGQWVVNQWLKKAVLLYFRTHDNAVMDAGYTRFFDKVPLKYAARSQADDGDPAPAAHARGAAGRRAPRLLHRPQRRAHAQLREHRRLRRQRHHGGHLGHRRLLRADRQERAPVGGRRHRRRARATAGRDRPSSKTTASSARAPKWSKASSSRKAR